MPLDITDWQSPANIVANVIVDRLSEIFTLGTNLFIGLMPESPNDCICILDSGGGEQDPVNAIDDASFQIYSRNSSYLIGYNLQSLIKTEIQSISPTIINDEVVIGVWMKSNIASLGRDDSDRSLFSSNYRMKIDTQKDLNREGERDVFIDGGNANSF